MTSMFTRKVKEGNAEFKRKLDQYKTTYKALNDIEESFKKHLEVTKSYITSCSQIGVQMSFFFANCEDPVTDRMAKFALANSEVENIVLKSMKKLYNEEILQPLNVLKVLDGEIQKAIKERKKLLQTQNSRFKKWESKKKEKKNLEELIRKEKQLNKEASRGIFNKKRKTIPEINQEVVESERAFRETEASQMELTALIIKKFDSLHTSLVTGELISSPVSGLVANQFHFAKATVSRVGEILDLFRESNVFTQTLEKYDKAQVDGFGLDTAENIASGPVGFVFGRVLTHSCPDVICDSIEYVKQGLKVEGLFRIPGNRTNVAAIKEAYDKNEKNILIDRTDFDVHDVCSAIKLFFKELPEPLMGYKAYDELERYFSGDRTNARFDDRAIVQIVQNNIEAPNAGLLGLLLNFLKDITKHASINQMTSKNLATCLAPVLLRAKASNNKAATQMRNMGNLPSNIATVSVLIDHAREFGVPDQAEVEAHTNIDEQTLKKLRRQNEDVVRLQMQNANEMNIGPSRVPPPVQPRPLASPLPPAAKQILQSPKLTPLAPMPPSDSRHNGGRLDYDEVMNTLASPVPPPSPLPTPGPGAKKGRVMIKRETGTDFQLSPQPQLPARDRKAPPVPISSRPDVPIISSPRPPTTTPPPIRTRTESGNKKDDIDLDI